MSKTKVKASDIYEGKLSVSQIQDIHPDLVYDWLKSGAWNKKAFFKWLEAIRVLNNGVY